MKFKYDMSDNYKELYDEANGLMINQKRIHKTKKIKKFTQQMFSLILMIFIIGIFFVLLGFFLRDEVLKIIGIVLISLGLFIFIFIKILFNKGANSDMNSHKGVLQLAKNSIIDIGENGVKVKFSNDKIKKIIISKNIVLFIANDPTIIFVPNNNDLIKYIKQNYKVEIIDIS